MPTLLTLAAIAVTRSAQPTGQQVIDQMADMYGHLKSYSDTGEVKDAPMALTFKTRFKAPNLFYFEYVENSSAPNWIRKTSAKDEVETLFLGKSKHEAYHLAIGGFTGVSMGAAANVPPMLIPTGGWGGFRGDSDNKIIGSETNAGEKCWLVTTAGQGTLLIGTTTHALHEIRQTMSGIAFKTIYHFKLNPTLTNKDFAKPKA